MARKPAKPSLLNKEEEPGLRAQPLHPKRNQPLENMAWRLARLSLTHAVC